MKDFIKKLITPDMVSLWVPDGLGGAMDLIRGNQGTAYGTHPNVPVISTFQPPNLLTDGGLNLWDDADNLTHWSKIESGTSIINREATEKIEGDYSCRFDVDASNSNVRVHQTPSLTPLKRYKLIVWYKNSVAGKTSQVLLKNAGSNVYLKEDGTWNVGTYWVALPNSIVWTSYELYFYGHADYSEYQFVLSRKTAPSSSIYLDNVSIEELKSSLINPSVGWVFGGDDYIIVPDAPCWNLTTKGSVGMWFKLALAFADGSNATGLYFSSNKRMRNFYFSTSNSRLYYLAPDTSVKVYSDRTSWEPEWHYVEVTNDGAVFRMYIDTVLQAVTPNSSGTEFFQSTGDLYLGNVANGFQGHIALPFVSKECRFQQQGENFYLATKGFFAPRGS